MLRRVSKIAVLACVAAILTGMEPEAAYALTVTASSRNAGAPTQ